MADEGVNFGEKLARDVKEVTERILAARGKETKQVFGRGVQRQTRFYKAPGGGIAAPSNSTTPSSATCTLMKWNSAGTAIEETNTTETVYSFSEYAANSIFQAKQVGGKIFADPASSSGGSTVSMIASHYSSKADLDLTNSHATNYALVGQGAVNTVGTGFGHTVGTTWCDEAGTYIISYDIEFRVEKFGDEGSWTFEDTSTNNQTFHLLYERELYAKILVWDESGASTAGTTVADTVIGGCYPLTIDDQNINDGSTGDFAFAPWRHATLTAGFSLTQATLDSLTGDAQFGLFILYQGTAGTKKAALKATVTGIHIPDVDSGLAIGLTPATP